MKVGIQLGFGKESYQDQSLKLEMSLPYSPLFVTS